MRETRCTILCKNVCHGISTGKECVPIFAMQDIYHDTIFQIIVSINLNKNKLKGKCIQLIYATCYAYSKQLWINVNNSVNEHRYNIHLRIYGDVFG